MTLQLYLVVFRLIEQYLIVRRVNIINRVISSHVGLITRVLECLRPSIFWMAIPIYETIRLELGDRIDSPSPSPPRPSWTICKFANARMGGSVMEQQLVAIKSSLKLNEKIFLSTRSDYTGRNFWDSTISFIIRARTNGFYPSIPLRVWSRFRRCIRMTPGHAG